MADDRDKKDNVSNVDGGTSGSALKTQGHAKGLKDEATVKKERYVIVPKKNNSEQFTVKRNYYYIPPAGVIMGGEEYSRIKDDPKFPKDRLNIREVTNA